MNFIRANLGRVLVLTGIVFAVLPLPIGLLLGQNYIFEWLFGIALGGVITAAGFIVLHKEMRWSYFLLIGGTGLVSYFLLVALTIAVSYVVTLSRNGGIFLFSALMLFSVFTTPFGAILTIAGAIKLIMGIFKK